MNNLSIRKITKSDLLILLNFRNDSDFIQYCTKRKNIVTLDEFEKEILYDFSKDRQVQFLILLNDLPVGTVWIYALNDQLNHAFISTFIAEPWRKKGFGVYAHCRVLQFMFEEVEVSTMYADVYIENLFSTRTMERRGWKFSEKLNEKTVRYKCSWVDFKNESATVLGKCTYIK